ncbi:MAG: hypothetical protein P9L94_05195 [Candidatus Hinthialibacter antarcticus]|nr:hypothetical protein [Candidatus Hinthialibacter antarcticus]
MNFSWLKISCPYCAARIPISADRCTECRSIIPHEAGDKIRGRLFIAVGVSALLFFLLLIGGAGALFLLLIS